jgi:hypothetical protein
MNTLACRLLAIAAVAAAGWLAVAGGAAGDKAGSWQPIPPGAYKELLGRSAKVVEEGLGSKDKEGLERAQIEALRIAVYADATTAGDAGQREAVKATAVQIARLIKEKGSMEAATKLAASLRTLKPGGAGKTSHDLGQYLDDLGELMNAYRTKKKGGEGLPTTLQTTAPLKTSKNGIEEKLVYLNRKKMAKPALAKEADELALLGYKFAADGALTATFAKAQPKGAKEWRELSVAMRDGGIALAEAARKKDADGVFRAANILDSACTRCHNEFRKKN